MSMSTQDILSEKLKKVGEWTSDMEKFISTQPPETLALIVEHANPGSIARALCTLDKASILTPEYIALFAKHPEIQALEQVLWYLGHANMLLPEYIAMVIDYKELDSLSHVLDQLLKSKILTPDYFLAIVRHPKPGLLSAIFCTLKENELLTPENQALAVGHAHTESLFYALTPLAHERILKKNFYAVATNSKPEELTYALCSLHLARILTHENREWLASCADSTVMARALYKLQSSYTLTQENFNALRAPNHALLLSDYAYEHIWPKVDERSLPQWKFNELLTAAEHSDPSEAKKRIEHVLMGKSLVFYSDDRMFKDSSRTDALVKPQRPKMP